jgi:hypothetical protein
MAGMAFSTTSGALSAAAANSPLLTVAQATQAFDTTWPRFDAAFVQGQLGVLRQYSTQDVFEAASGATGCGCTWYAPDSSALFSVPPQQHYPLTFLAQMKMPAPPHSIYSPYVTLVVLTKSTAQSQWKVAYLIRYASAHGYLTSSLAQTPSRAASPLSWMTPDLADYLTTYATTGSPPPGAVWLDAGSLATEAQQTLDVQAEVTAIDDHQQTGFSAVDNSAAFAYPGGDIICGSYMETALVKPNPPKTVITQSASGDPWGGGLAPGSYSSLSKIGLTLVCFHATTTQRPNLIAPISFFGGVYQLSGNS